MGFNGQAQDGGRAPCLACHYLSRDESPQNGRFGVWRYVAVTLFVNCGAAAVTAIFLRRHAATRLHRTA